MYLALIAEHLTPYAGAAVTAGVALRYGSDSLLRLVAGITAIVAKDERSRGFVWFFSQDPGDTPPI